MSGTKGSSGFGSQSNEHMDNKTEIKQNRIDSLLAALLHKDGQTAQSVRRSPSITRV